MRKIVILGSTGSIGESTLRVAHSLADELKVVGLAVGSDYPKALQQAREFGVFHVAVADEEAARRCRAEAPPGIAVHEGAEGVEELAALDGVDVLVCAVVGVAALRPVLAAVKRGTDVALATKEVLVAAGQIVMNAAGESGSRILPVDSEHSAIFQCLHGNPADGKDDRQTATWGRADVRRIWLTASGGPFGMTPEKDLNSVTVEQALCHPRWDMGKKVTIDSATLMNKGLEIIEARWLFGLPTDRIDVLLHPESIVHSLVEFVDGSVMAQLSVPDMRFAIQYALTYPERLPGDLPELDLPSLRALHFERPDPGRFPALTVARRAAAESGTMPAVMNAANEVAVERFLSRAIAFPRIWELVDEVMGRHESIPDPSLDGILEADVWARRIARELA